MAVDLFHSLANLTLCDYFAVIGFDKTTGIQVDRLAELSADIVGYSNDSPSSPLDCSYEAKVLCHMPAHREGFPFMHEIASLCMPKGLRLYTERKVPREPIFHSFILVKEDGTRVNGCSLVFYEPLHDAELRQQIYDMQMEHIRQMTVDDPSLKVGSGNTCETPSMPRRRPPPPSPHQYPPGTVSSGDHTLPLKSSSTKRSSRADSCDESPRRRQQRHRSHSSHLKQRMSFYDSVSKPIYISKCICFVTRAPIVYSIENLLRALWRMAVGGFVYLTSPIVPIESVIYWALHEVPLPLPGTCLQIKYGDCNLVVRRPSGHELPLFDYPIQILFNFISIERFIKLYTCFMLEHQILICSKYMDRLMLVAECLSALIFPFRWQLTYVPILPYSQLKFMEAPVPYLMGLCYDDQIPEQIFQSNVCILDIDTGKLDYPEDIPTFPRQREIAVQIAHILMRFKAKDKQLAEPPEQTEEAVRLCRNPAAVSDGMNSKKRSQEWSMKRMSRSFDNSTSMRASSLKSVIGNEPANEEEDSVETTSTSLAVEKADVSEIKQSTSEKSPKHVESYNAYLRGLRFNRAIRELFLCNFAGLFASYEHFLINNASLNEPEHRESVVNFDKVSFLSEQPESYLPFLAAFLETQMFTSFVDAKILAHCQAQTEDTRYIGYFDRKIAQLIQIVGNDASMANSESKSTPLSHHSERPLDFLFMSVGFAQHQVEVMNAELAITADYEIEEPHLLPENQSESVSETKPSPLFPDIQPERFELSAKFGSVGIDGSVVSSPWRQQNRKQRVLNVLESAASRLTPNGRGAKPTVEGAVVDSPMKQNKKFVDQLLKESKTKTKRMLVAKMGKEAVYLGHGDLGITGVEENTLVAGLSDLLERIWSHGLKKKQGKSALWSHIFAHYDRGKLENFKPVDRYSNLSPGDAIGDIQNGDPSANDGENAKTLNELLDSIRFIAKSIELMSVDGLGTGDKENSSTAIQIPASTNFVVKHENDPRQSSSRTKDANDNNTTKSSTWQTSLFKAANFIYGKIDKIATIDPLNPVASSSMNTASVASAKSAPRRGRSTERCSSADSAVSSNDSREGRRVASTASRIKSKPRFYHHEDEYSKRLRHASRQRRAQAAAAATTAGREGQQTAGYRSDSMDSAKLRNLPPLPNNSRDETAVKLARREEDFLPAAKIEDIVRLARTKLSDVTSGTAFNNNENIDCRSQKRSESMSEPLTYSALHKSSSISDFSPHFSKGNSADENENHQEREIYMSASMAPGETRTLGRPPRRPFQQQRDSRKRTVSRTRGMFAHRGSEPSNGISNIEIDRLLSPLPTNMTYDLRNVMRMTEIKTDIGFARAFVRLALERKLLHKHLKAVLSDTHLLQFVTFQLCFVRNEHLFRKMYKRYAFLRCEEEHEQFLYHILSLNAVEFSCFTHTFISTKIRYEVVLVATIDQFFSSFIWIMLAGSLGSTSNIYIPSNSLKFKFDFKNLGVLSTLRIGHSASEKGTYPSKWFLDYVLVRNNVTAQTYVFNCGRWFGRGVDDGALERLLVAENLNSTNTASAMSEADAAELESGAFLPSTSDVGGVVTSALFSFGFNNFMSRPESPVTGGAGPLLLDTAIPAQKVNQHFCYSTGSRRSPSVGRSSNEYGMAATAPKITDLQHKLGMAVNALVKHFFTEKDYRSSARLPSLLCGDNGLVPCLEQIFEMGRQDTLFSNRFFRQPYPWDYIERVFAWFVNFFRNGESRKLEPEQRSLIIYAYTLVVKITANNAVGKEGKFHIFILLALRDHILSGLLPLMAWTPVTMQIYEESAFLRQPQHLSYVSKLLSSLNEFNFTLEKSLIYGIEL